MSPTPVSLLRSGVVIISMAVFVLCNPMPVLDAQPALPKPAISEAERIQRQKVQEVSEYLEFRYREQGTEAQRALVPIYVERYGVEGVKPNVPTDVMADHYRSSARQFGRLTGTYEAPSGAAQSWDVITKELGIKATPPPKKPDVPSHLSPQQKAVWDKTVGYTKKEVEKVALKLIAEKFPKAAPFTKAVPVINQIISNGDLASQQFGIELDRMLEVSDRASFKDVQSWPHVQLQLSGKSPEQFKGAFEPVYHKSRYQFMSETILKDPRARDFLSQVDGENALKGVKDLEKLTPAQLRDHLLKSDPEWAKEVARRGGPKPLAGADAIRVTGRLKPADQEMARLGQKMAERVASQSKSTREKLQKLDGQKPADFEESLRNEAARRNLILEQEERVKEFQLATGIVSNFLKHAGGDAAKVGQALEYTAKAVTEIWKSVINHTVGSLVCPLTIISSATDLIFNLIGLGGPNMNQIILEQLQAIRQDIAQLRREMHLEFSLLRRDVYEAAERVLTRMEAIEFVMARNHAEVMTGLREIQSRQSVLENEILANHYQILSRFAEAYTRDIHVRFREYQGLLPELPALTKDNMKDVLGVKYNELLATFATGAIDHPASQTLAGGDTRIGQIYGTAVPKLDSDSVERLFKIGENPGGPWYLINDFVGLARSAKTEMVPGRARTSVLDFDQERLINPLSWQLCVHPYLDLALANPALFHANPVYKRWLAQMYLRGEDLNDGLNRLSRDPDGAINRRVFDRLMSLQLIAAAELESVLKKAAAEAEKDVHGISPFLQNWRDGIRRNEWTAFAHLPPDKCPPPTQDIHTEANSAEPGWRSSREVEAGKLKFDDADAAELEKLIPDAYRLAVQNGVGRIELKYVDLDWSVTDTWLNDAYGRNYAGNVRITLEANYVPTSDRVRPNTAKRIFRKTLTAGNRVHFALHGLHYVTYYDADDPAHRGLNRIRMAAWWAKNQTGKDPPQKALIPVKLDDPRTKTNSAYWSMPYDVELVESPKWMNEIHARRTEVAERWGELKRQLFAGHGREVDEALRAAHERRMEAELKEWLLGAAMKLESGFRTDLTIGAGAVGQAFRKFYSVQQLTKRFIELAMPDAARTDSELQECLFGSKAVFNWDWLAERLKYKPDKSEPVRPLVERQGNDPEKYTSPLVDDIRQRTYMFRSQIDQALTKQAASPKTFYHPVVEATLIRIVLAAEHLKVDLGAELRGMGVTPRPHWELNRSEYRAATSEEAKP